MPNAITRYQVGGRAIAFLADNAAWTCRFEIGSDTSNRVYTIARRKGGAKTWACSCPGWIRHRHCKHLDKLAPTLKEIAKLQTAGKLQLPQGD